MSKKNNQPHGLGELEAAQPTIDRPSVIDHPMPNLEATHALELWRQINGAMSEHGTSKFTIELDGSGFLKSIQPVTDAVPTDPGPKDIIVQCPRKNKKCIATFEVKRVDGGNVELCCNECVGPSRDNEYQKML